MRPSIPNKFEPVCPQKTSALSFRTISLELWQDFVDQQRESTVFHHRKWIELLHEFYGLPLKIFAVVEGERVRAAAPFLETKTFRGRSKLTSLPFSDHVPVLHDSTEALTALVDGICSEPGDHPTITVRSELDDLGLSRADGWVRHEICLPGNGEQIGSGFSSALKRNLKKARRSNLQFTEETSLEAMEHFYRLHVITRRRRGVPVQKRSFFMSLHDRLIGSQLGFVGLIRRENEVIAAAVFLTYNGTLMYKYGASEPTMLEYRPNEFLIDNVLQLGTQRSYHRFDFGISDRNDAGLRSFKMKWGSVEQPVPVTFLRGVPEHHDDQSLLRRLASHVIRVSPKFVCRFIGAAAYKYSQ